jgi:hypothetical protein
MASKVKNTFISVISINDFCFRIANESINNRNTIDWFQMKSLCKNYDNNSITLHKYLDKLIVQFNRIKTQFSPNERRSLRQHFLHLADECNKSNDFQSATIVTKQLADSAYKLPYCKCNQYICDD